MVDHLDTEVFTYRSTSPASSPNFRMGINGDSGCREFQDTVPFGDEMVLDSSLPETPFQKFCEDTLPVNSEDCADEDNLDQAFDSDVEVVSDSEDDDGGMEKVTVADSLNLPRRNTRAAGQLLESDGSNDHECQMRKQGSDCNTMICRKGDDPSQVMADADVYGSRLAFPDSQEPGESTQAGALDFVDHFLLDKDLNVSPFNDPKNTVRTKSPAFSGLKGHQTLAKRIKTQIPTMKTRIFDWTGNDPLEIFKVPPVTRRETTCFKTREDHIADNNPAANKALIDLNKDIKDSMHPLPKSLKNKCAEHRRTKQASEISPGDMFVTHEQLQDVASKEQLEPVEDVFDVGINTQIAAEAMGALLYAAHVCGSDPCSFQENLCENIEGGVEKANKEDPSSTGYSGEYHFKLAAAGWGRSKRVKRRAKAKESMQSIIGKLHRTNSSHASKGADFPHQIMHSEPGSVSETSKRSTSDAADKSPRGKSLTTSPILKEPTRRRGSRKAADIFWKDLRSRRNLGHIRLLFSQHLDADTIKQQKKIMVRLGISLASSSADATHFIADKFARTRNMLESMALGKPVVTHLWLESCGQARCLIDEKSYILRDDKKEKEIGFCMPTSLARARQSPLLKGLKVCITQNIRPDRDMMADLVRASHGQVVEITQTNDGKLLDDLLILSCEEDREICLPLIIQGAAIYTSELLLNGIVIQKLEYARHRLFTNAITRNQRNTRPITTPRVCSAY